MAKQLRSTNRRPFTVAVILALVVGILFLAPFFGIIALSTIAAFVFYPVFAWLSRRLKSAAAAAAITVSMTFIAIIFPVLAIGFATFNELQQAAKDVSSYAQSTDLNTVTTTILEKTNRSLGTLTGGALNINIDQVREFVTNNISRVFSAIASFIGSSIGGISTFFISLILYVYIFTALLMNHGALIRTFKALNPLGDTASDLYLTQAGAMTKAMVRGQFIIALCQGFIGAISLYIAGVDVFWVMFLLLTVLSFIPLGGGVVTIPIGIVLLITGNIWQGVLVLATHFVVVTNIDNILRPMLVPKSARLNSALTLLSVFAGLGVFGLLGIVIGPVLMILIVTTIKLYLAETKSSTAEQLTPA